MFFLGSLGGIWLFNVHRYCFIWGNSSCHIVYIYVLMCLVEIEFVLFVTMHVAFFIVSMVCPFVRPSVHLPVCLHVAVCAFFSVSVAIGHCFLRKRLLWSNWFASRW